MAQRFAELLTLLRRQDDDPLDGTTLVGSDLAAVNWLHKVWSGNLTLIAKRHSLRACKQQPRSPRRGHGCHARN